MANDALKLLPRSSRLTYRRLLTISVFLLPLFMRFSHRNSKLPTNLPSTTGTLVFHERKFNGLGAQLLRLVDALALADSFNWQLCLKQTRYWNYGCAPDHGWSCYFESLLCKAPPNCRELASLSNRQLQRARCATVSTPESASRAAGVLPPHDLLASRSRASRIWRLNTRTYAHMNSFIWRLSLPKGRYVGVHVRRGDKVREVPTVPLTRYARAVKAVSPQDMPVFVASDSWRAIEGLRSLLRDRTVVTLAEARGREGHIQAEANRRYLKNNYAVVVELLAEMQILADSAIFVGTFSSNMGRFVHLIRRGFGNTSVSLDDQWASGVAWKTFGKPYCHTEDSNRNYCDLHAIS